MFDTEELKQYPIYNCSSEIIQSLQNSKSHFLILTADTGTGKSTVLPLFFLDKFDGKIIMTEPRRLATLSVAQRLADLYKEKVGETIGYKIHLDNKSSSKTKLEVVTEAILIKYLHNGFDDSTVNLVILDEAHERSIYFDMALSFLKEEVQLRDNLFVLVMSATINTDKIKNYLGNEDSVVVKKIEGRNYPIKIIYDDEKSIEERAVVESDKGNVLVFQPSIKEIRKSVEKIESQINQDKVDVLMLHSSVSLDEQRKVLEPSTKRKIIVSSSIAETSLTIEGIKVVVDSGFSRVNRINVANGMENLVTEVETQFSAIQRSGRAGRMENGICYRMWNENDKRKVEIDPEIIRSDISTVILECSKRGIYDYKGIDFLDNPSETLWQKYKDLLIQLEFLTKDGKITDEGKISLDLGINVRLSKLAIEGYKSGCFDKVSSLILKYGDYSESANSIKKRFLDNIEAKLSRSLQRTEKCENNERLLVLYGFPDRLAKRVEEENVNEYQLATGRKVKLHSKYKHFPKWIVAFDVLAGDVEGIVFSFEEVLNEDAEQWTNERSVTKTETRFVNNKVSKVEKSCYGKIVLFEKRVAIQKEDVAYAWIGKIKEEGMQVLPISDETKCLLTRKEFFLQQKESKNIDLTEVLKESCEEWLLPFISSGNQITEKIVYDSLYWFLDGKTVEQNVPNYLMLPNGKKVNVIYERQTIDGICKIRPVIEIIIQRIFGCFTTPKILNMKVLLRLLSPSRRPLQITDDLENFWTNSWIDICKEMKGRYPKHDWDYKKSQN